MAGGGDSALGRASETALIVTVRLPRALEAVRQRAVQDAGAGLRGHVTLLYPFVPPGALDSRLRARIAQVVAAHVTFSFRLTGPAHWPETLYAAVEPEAPFRTLQADLAAAFRGYPLYGGAFEFVPHVTIAEGESATLPEIANDPAWAGPPVPLKARYVELIVRDVAGWKTKWRLPLQRSVWVLVCGERLRGDDGAAIRAAATLPEDVRSLAEVIEVGQLSVEALIEVPAGVAVIVADAAVGIPAGHVIALPLAKIAHHGAGAAPATSHSLPPDQVLALAEEMRGLPVRGSFVGIGGSEFAFGEILSPAVEAGLPVYAAALADEIRRLAAG